MNKYRYIILCKLLLTLVLYGCKPHKDMHLLNKNRLIVSSNSISTDIKEKKVLDILSSTPKLVEQTEFPNIVASVQTQENLFNFVFKTEEEDYTFTLNNSYTLKDGKSIDVSSITTSMFLYLPIRAAKSDNLLDIMTNLEFNIISEKAFSNNVYYPLNDDSREHIKLKLGGTIEVDFFSKPNVERFESRKHDQIPEKKSLIKWKHWYKNDVEFSYISSLNPVYTPKDGEEIYLLFYVLLIMKDGSDPRKYNYIRIPINQDRITLVQGMYHDVNRKDISYKYSY